LPGGDARLALGYNRRRTAARRSTVRRGRCSDAMPDSSLHAGESRPSLFSFAQIQHVLRVEFGRAQRYHYPLACLVIGVDQLGLIRDRQGYDQKEEVLAAVIAMLARATRTSDFLGRTADDRLIAVVPHTPAEGAHVLASRLASESRALAPKLGLERLSLSLGLATSAGTSVMFHDALLEAAQAAYDEAVAQGGGRTCERALEGPR
jgi:diguanylate cyclase (GGDEF)-like protein